MPKNQWARSLINSNERDLHRRMDVPAKQRTSKRMHQRWSGGGSLRCLSQQKCDYLEREYGLREYRDEKKSEYLGLGIPGVYIGRLQSSSRLLALNGFYVWICYRLAQICNCFGP